MTVLRLCAGTDHTSLFQSTASLSAVLRRASGQKGPVIVLIHGYKYDSALAHRCPHRRLFQTGGPWLKQLGFGMGHDDEGLALAFGWPARGFPWQAVGRARAAGRHLAQALAQLHHAAPHRPIHILTHSMGAEVAFAAIRALPRAAIGRLITLTPAAYRSTAVNALSTGAGQRLEWINVASRENLAFDVIYERLVRPPVAGDRVIGSGIGAPNAVTLRLDCKHQLKALERVGGFINSDTVMACHWSSYTRAGALGFYARLMRTPDAVPLAALRYEPPVMPGRRVAQGWRPSCLRGPARVPETVFPET